MKRLEIHGANPSSPAEIARTLLTLADPIRLRMLNLMMAGSAAPEQFSQVLGVELKTITKHLVYFREREMVATHTKRNIKYYSVRRRPETPQSRLISFVLELIEHEPVMQDDVAVFNSLCKGEWRTGSAEEISLSDHLQGAAL
jgi:DNA-binding transcriptional ArsR family regulator